MHADVILKWAREHAHGQWMTEKEFDFLFCDFFSKRQLREIRQILNDNGIVFVKELPAEALETVPASEVSEVSEATKVEDAAVTAAEADDDAFDTEDALQQDQDWGDSAEVGEDTRPFDEQTRLAHEWNLPRSNLSNEVLCQMIQEGNRQARQDLLVNNRNLVLAYVQRYLRSPWCHLSKEDLEQIGL
jgi:RNA polymerase primary sigma factor